MLDCALARYAGYRAVRSHADLTQGIQTARVITLRQMVVALRPRADGRLVVEVALKVILELRTKLCSMLLNVIARDEREVVVAVRLLGFQLVHLVGNVSLHHHAVRVDEVTVDCLAATEVTITLLLFHFSDLAEELTLLYPLHVLRHLLLLGLVAHLLKMLFHDASNRIFLVIVDALTEADDICRVNVVLVESVTGLAHTLELGHVILRIWVRHMEALEVTCGIAVGTRLLHRWRVYRQVLLHGRIHLHLTSSRVVRSVDGLDVVSPALLVTITFP